MDSLLQRVLDLEARLKTENKSLRMQVLALEEQNDHLKNEIDMLKSNMSTKSLPVVAPRAIIREASLKIATFPVAASLPLLPSRQPLPLLAMFLLKGVMVVGSRICMAHTN